MEFRLLESWGLVPWALGIEEDIPSEVGILELGYEAEEEIAFLGWEYLD